MVSDIAVGSGLRLDCLGISHRTAAAELRERAGFPASMLRRALTVARRDPRIERLVIIATCHRTELYAETPDGTDCVRARLLNWWSAICNVPASDLEPCVYSLRGWDAAMHLFNVAAGLDSVVVGEAQIVGQVATAIRHSVSVHAASPLLKLAFRSAVRAGERARGTVWGRLQAASLGSASVDAAAAAANGLTGRNVVVVGAGEIAELALRSLVAHAPNRITIANRTIEAAVEMGAHHGADACPLSLLPELLSDADVVIAATRATLPLIHQETLRAAIAARPERPMTIVDVSLPRNVDVGARSIRGVKLVGIDELGPYVVAAHAERRAVIPTVERIVGDEIASLRQRVADRRPIVTRHRDARSASEALSAPIAV